MKSTLYATEIKYRQLKKLLIIATEKIAYKKKIKLKSTQKKNLKSRNKNKKSTKTCKNMK